MADMRSDFTMIPGSMTGFQTGEKSVFLALKLKLVD